jgi:hypothetical protein
MSRAFVEKWEVKMEQKMATSKHPKMKESVPISALRQNFQNEKYIRTLIAFR